MRDSEAKIEDIVNNQAPNCIVFISVLIWIVDILLNIDSYLYYLPSVTLMENQS